MKKKILVINPGSTSTKIAVFHGQENLLTVNITHETSEIQKFKKMADQLNFRWQVILDVLEDHQQDLDDLDAVSARGGLLKPIPGGTYLVNEKMKQHLREGLQGEHASNLGAVIAGKFAEEYNCPAFIVDPVIVDEMNDLARLSGLKGLERKSIFHALNQKAVAREASKELAKPYQELNLIVVHLGGGISVGLHQKGQVVDVNNALDGEGPFSPERSGGLPILDLLKMCFSGQYTKTEIKNKIKGQGGLVSYLETSDLRAVEQRIDNNDSYAKQVFEAMAYQVAKEVGALSTVVNGELAAIVISGGMAHSKRLLAVIKARIAFLAPVLVFPGEKEMEALAAGALRVLNGEEELKTY